MAKLEDKKINYMVMDTRNNYDVDYKIDNKNLNEYDEVFEKARRYVKLKRKIDRISEQLVKEIEKDTIEEKLKKIEEIANEG